MNALEREASAGCWHIDGCLCDEDEKCKERNEVVYICKVKCLLSSA